MPLFVWADKQDGPIRWWHMGGGAEDRVWYADVLLLFNVQGIGGFAWVQWYEKFGGKRGGKRHHDGYFPDIMDRRFPRLYLPEHHLGQEYEVVPLNKILGPAPMTKDVSVIHYTAAQEADRLELAGEEREAFLEEHGEYNEPLIPVEWNCENFTGDSCRNAACTKLHENQMSGADQARTQLCVVNLLVLGMSRGVWRPPWQKAGAPVPAPVVDPAVLEHFPAHQPLSQVPTPT
jgi:hypothetical protein